MAEEKKKEARQFVEISGTIEAVANQAHKNFRGTGFQRGIRINGNWYNLFSKDEKILNEDKRLTKGNVVKFKTAVGSNTFNDLEVTDVAEEKSNWKDDIIDFETLLDTAHKNGLVKTDTVALDVNMEKGYAIFKATVYLEFIDKDSKQKGLKIFSGIGDATQTNVSENIKKHFVRMAETRALARALRFATNNAKVSEVELTEDDKLVKEEKIEEKK